MKFLSTIVALLFATTAVQAQDYTEEDNYMFNHMSLGLSAGTTGVGLDLTMPLGKYVQVRAGAVWMPPVGITSKYDCAATMMNDKREQVQYISNSTVQVNDISIKATPTFLNGKLMFDLYPAPSFPLHVTLGAYFGAEKIIELKSVGDETRLQGMYSSFSSNYLVQGYDNVEGVKVGNYTLLPDCDGNINSWIQTSAIRPYAGLGWGKAYSEKGIDWMVEAGVIFWNTPKVYSRTNDLTKIGSGNYIDVERPKEELSGEKGAITKWFTTTQIYPVISFRLGFNLF